MANGELSTDLSLNQLTPASSVRAIGNDSVKHHAETKARRRAHDEENPEDSPVEPDDRDQHQLDSLA